MNIDQNKFNSSINNHQIDSSSPLQNENLTESSKPQLEHKVTIFTLLIFAASLVVKTISNFFISLFSYSSANKI